MARLKSLKPKSKTFIFTSYENDKQQNPVKVVFNRFPLRNELFLVMEKKEIFKDIDISKITEKETQSKLIDSLMKNISLNAASNNIDFKAFLNECVDRFDDFEYDTSKITTVNDYFQILPSEAAETIAFEIYDYAQKREEFTMGELSA